jgi:hypothetical protein
MKPNTATKKGLLTGVVMILCFGNNLLYKGQLRKQAAVHNLYYIRGRYYLGVADHSKQMNAKHSFGEYFSQGI